MNLIVVSDIFGETSALRELVTSLSAPYSATTILSPYDAVDIPFENEEAAYQRFQQDCGLDRLFAKLEAAVAQQTGPVDIIGFSVGASCAWRLAGDTDAETVRKIAYFYGSRIRESLSVTPQLPTSLIFPQHEKGFDIEPVISALKPKPHTEIIRTDYLHGFMNRHSVNFSEEGYRRFMAWLSDRW